MMAALTAAQGGGSVALLERNPKLGRKLYITGKGRCNVTNNADTQTLLANVPRNGKFLSAPSPGSTAGTPWRFLSPSACP